MSWSVRADDGRGDSEPERRADMTSECECKVNSSPACDPALIPAGAQHPGKGNALKRRDIFPAKRSEAATLINDKGGPRRVPADRYNRAHVPDTAPHAGG